MQTVLIIDDVEDDATVIALAIEKGIQGVTCRMEADFDKAIEIIAEFRPDAVVLDLMQGIESTCFPGQRTWKSVWDDNFCPIVIHSGSEADLTPPVPASHPFVKRINKGYGKVDEVVAALKDFRPAVEAIRSLRTEVNAVIHKVLRDTAGSGAIPTNDTAHLLHAGRRRIAASMDDPTLIGQHELTCWEQYLIPAIGNDPLTGDVLVKRGGAKDDPTNYRLLLTPSCDTARRGKVKTVLVAKCYPSSVMIEKLKSALKEKDSAKLQEHVMRLVLSQGAWNGWLPLPACGAVPGMVASLKDLDVIPLKSIGCTDDTKPCFERVASIDSPFREQIAWAYLTTAGRPGMPERALQPWAAELVNGAGAQAAAPAAPRA